MKFTRPGVTGGFLGFCKITVNNGMKTDIRGVLAVFGGAGGQSDRNPVAAQ